MCEVVDIMAAIAGVALLQAAKTGHWGRFSVIFHTLKSF
jgi:hypothetical protein